MEKNDKTNNTKSPDADKTEEKLRASEERFRLLSEAAEEGIIIHDNGIVLEANQALSRMFGYELSEIIGKSAEEAISAESWKTILDHTASRYDQPYEITAVRKDRSTFVCSVVGKSFNYNGRVLRVSIFRDITERKKAEELLRQSEEKYRTILDNMQEGYWEADLKGNYTFFNDVICRQLGYSREELRNVNTFNLSDEEYSRKLFHICKRIYETGEPVRNFHWQVIRKNGGKRDIEGSIFLLKNSSGQPKGFRGIAHDITDRRNAEGLLKQSEAQYRLLADHMKDQVWLLDLNLKITYVSPSVERLTGYTFEEIIKLPLNEIITSSSFQTAMEFFSVEMPKALAASVDYVLNRKLELEFICKNRQTIWGETTFSFIRDENSKPIAILAEGRDITERKKMENALRESEENFRHSLDDSPLGVRISTLDGETIYANRAILEMYGYDSIEELKNTSLKERYTPETYAEFQIRRAKRLKGEPGPSEYEISIVRKGGAIRHLHVFRKEIFWNGKKQSQVIYQDITLRRQAEKRLNDILENLRRSIKVTIQVLGTASEARDPYTAGHQRRVADLARAIATEMQLPHDKIEAIRMAAAIHDIGKISIPSEILCKPSVLTRLEFSFIKAHPQQSYEIIKDVESPWPLADIVRQHHERLDGSGYPLGLKNEEIIIEARILAVADVVEAMISYRPYRPALGVDIALAEIENHADILYDRDVVNACLKLFREKNYQMI